MPPSSSSACTRRRSRGSTWTAWSTGALEGAGATWAGKGPLGHHKSQCAHLHSSSACAAVQGPHGLHLALVRAHLSSSSASHRRALQVPAVGRRRRERRRVRHPGAASGGPGRRARARRRADRHQRGRTASQVTRFSFRPLRSCSTRCLSSCSLHQRACHDAPPSPRLLQRRPPRAPVTPTARSGSSSSSSTSLSCSRCC
jgi:hypothetical protein